MKHFVAALIIVASLGVCRSAGDYLAAAVPAMSLPLDGEWDPAFFEKVRPAATGLKLVEGQTSP